MKKYIILFLLSFLSLEIVAQVPPVVFLYPKSGITMKVVPGQMFTIYTELDLSGGTATNTNNTSDSYTCALLNYPSLTTATFGAAVKGGYYYASRTESNPGVYQYVIEAKNNRSQITSRSLSEVVTVIVEEAKISPAGTVAFCSGSGVLLTANKSVSNSYSQYSTPYFYQWKKNGVNITDATNSTYYAVEEGNYTVQVSNNGTYSPISSPTYIPGYSTSPVVEVKKVNTPSSAEITTNSLTTFCEADSVVLSANLGYQFYQWQLNGVNIEGATSSTFVAKKSGEYKVVINPSTSCSMASNVITLNVLNSPVVNITTSYQSMYYKDSVTLIANLDTSLTYQWSIDGVLISGAILSKYTAQKSGEYQVLVRQNSNGCTNKAKIPLQIFDKNTYKQANFSWAKSLGASQDDLSSNIVYDYFGNSYITGFFNGTVDFDPGDGKYELTSVGSSDGYILKLDVNGNFLWANSWGTTLIDFPRSITIDSIGNSYITGSFYGTLENLNSVGGADVLIKKFNSDGKLIFSTSFGSTGHDHGYSIKTDKKQNIYLAGYYGGSGFIAKLDKMGSLLWQSNIGPSDISSIELDFSNNIYVTGRFTGTKDFDPGSGLYNLSSDANSYDAFLAKYNSSGSLLFAKKLVGTSSQEGANSISIDANGFIFVTGYLNDDVFITKFDGSGNTIWDKRVGGKSKDYGFSISVDLTGDVYVTGSFTGTVDFDPGSKISNLVESTGSNIFILKLDALGNFIWAKKIGGQNTSIAVHPSGNVFVTGSFSSSADFNPNNEVFTLSTYGLRDIFVLKLCASTVSPGKISGQTLVCPGSSYTYSIEPVNGATSYTWTLPTGWSATSTTNTITTIAGPNPGNITVTANNECGSSSIQTLSVLLNIPSKPSLIKGPSSVCDNSKNIYSIDPIPGAISYTWILPNGYTTISNSITIETIANYTSGNLSVSVNNECTASSLQILALTVNKLPNVIAVATKNMICSGDPVVFTGAGASTYVWNNGVTNGVTISPLITKTYTVVGTDVNGCKNKDSIIVSVNSLPKVVATSNKTIVCSGDSVILTGSGESTYSWDNNVSNGVSFIPNATKTYTVTGTDANGCMNTASVLVTVNSLPTVVANTSKTAICTGDNVTLTGIGASTYTWDNNVSNGVSFIPTTTKTYIVTGTDANGCKNTANVIVTVNTLPTVTANSNKSVVCSGDSVTLTGSGASTYTWDNNVINAVSFVINATKIYTVTGTDANGCKNTSIVSVSVNSLPTVVAVASKTAVCLGENVTLTGTGASTFVWDNNVKNGVSFVPSVTKTYTVKGTDANGCINVATVNVVVNALPTVVATASKTIVCLGENVTLTGSGASTYLWDNNVSNGVSFVPSVNNVYRVTGTDVNGCINTAKVSVEVNSFPVVFANTTYTAVCSGESVTLTGAGASTYTWNNNVSNGVSFVPSVTKTYTVTGTDVNGCKNTANVLVTVNALPKVVATATTKAICIGESVTLTGTGASTYTWDNNVSNGVSFVPNTTKTYIVTGTDANGCKNTSNVSVTVNSLPVVIATATKTVICIGEEVTLSGSGASTYTWDNNVSNCVFFVPSETKTYTVTGTNANGCSKKASVNVKVNMLPPVSITLNGNTTYCSTNLTELVSTTSSSYLWNSGETTKSIKPTQTGNYFVKITDINGCSQTSQPVDVIVNNCAGIENLDNLFIKTYPNPVTDYLMIEINETLVGKNYFVTDVAGKLLISGSFEKTINQIDFNQYASGSYMLHINEQTFQFIKE